MFASSLVLKTVKRIPKEKLYISSRCLTKSHYKSYSRYLSTQTANIASSTSTNIESPPSIPTPTVLPPEEENDDEETPQKGAAPNEVRLRVAVVGGGVAGLSTALHLAPLAAAGLISSPIHLYESSLRSPVITHSSWCDPTKLNQIGSGSQGRAVGVGIWSTALIPFTEHCNDRKSHMHFLKTIQDKGRWVNKVGYRTPDGNWLAKSNLECGSSLLKESCEEQPSHYCNDPALLFLTEKELITALREAVSHEEMECGTIKTHYANKPGCSNGKVDGILAHYDKDGAESSSVGLGRLVFGNGAMSKGMYHVIVDAAGTNSCLRRCYGSALHATKKKKIQSKSATNKSCESIEDREYTVFRGTSPLTDKETNMKGVSFQTWGEGNSMRFATVPMQSGQAWFVTTSDPRFRGEKPSYEERKQIILEEFKSWHDPIASLIESTPAESILMENAVAHQYSIGPVLSLHNQHNEKPSDIPTSAQIATQPKSSTAEQRRLQQDMDQIEGLGPILCFVGDANMTVDPVLAQGFTMAMEDASLLASTIEKSCTSKPKLNKTKKMSSTGNDVELSDHEFLQNLQKTYNKGLSSMKPQMTFNPKLLRSLLRQQYVDTYEPRLLCLLRATELVQNLAQPSSKALTGILSTHVIRPTMRFMPDFIKKPIFDYMVKYSLGMTSEKKKLE